MNCPSEPIVCFPAVSFQKPRADPAFGGLNFLGFHSSAGRPHGSFLYLRFRSINPMVYFRPSVRPSAMFTRPVADCRKSDRPTADQESIYVGGIGNAAHIPIHSGATIFPPSAAECKRTCLRILPLARPASFFPQAADADLEILLAPQALTFALKLHRSLSLRSPPLPSPPFSLTSSSSSSFSQRRLQESASCQSIRVECVSTYRRTRHFL